MKYNKIFMLFFFILGIMHNTSAQAQKYEPTFESLERVNPVPEWFKDAKFGIYFHWGVFSVPAYANEWYPRNMYFKGSNENKHHIETYGDITEWPYNNFITGAKDKQGNFVQFSPKLKSVDKTGIIAVPGTSGYQNWEAVKKTVKLDAGHHLLKLVIDSDGLNIDKMVFEEVAN